MSAPIYPTRFLHCTYNDRTALCDGRILVDRDSMTVEDFGLPACPTCVILNDHYSRERRRLTRKKNRQTADDLLAAVDRARGGPAPIPRKGYA